MKSELAEKHCKACAPGAGALSDSEVKSHLQKVDGWQAASGQISKTFKFKDYHHTMAFVNAVAWVAHREDHHPDMEVGYNKCLVRYSTHSAGGLTENDFICAAKVDALLQE
jgi:4a-hydroxytetrahydrobiopterin dehydratase